MQKPLSELVALPPESLSRLIEQLDEPLLVTSNDEPQFVAQSLSSFERMVRRLRALEAEQGREAKLQPTTFLSNVIQFRR